VYINLSTSYANIHLETQYMCTYIDRHRHTLTAKVEQTAAGTHPHTRVLRASLDKAIHHIHGLRVTSLIHKWDMAHSYVGHDSFAQYVGHDSFISGALLIHKWNITHSYDTWDMTHLYAGYDAWSPSESDSGEDDTSRQGPVCDMTGSYVGHDSFICGTWLLGNRILRRILEKGWYITSKACVCVTCSREYVGNDWCICETWLNRMWHMIHDRILKAILEIKMRRVKALRVTWLIYAWDMTHSYVGHDSESCFEGDFGGCDASHSKSMCDVIVWRDSFIRGTWLFHSRDMTHAWSHFEEGMLEEVIHHIGRDAFIRGTWLIHTWIKSRSYLEHEFNSHSEEDFRECDTLRLRPVNMSYGVATVSRIDKIIGLFCKRDL